MKIDHEVREALEARAARGRDSGADALWDQITSDVAVQETSDESNVFEIDLGTVEDVPVKLSKLGWLAAVASFLLLLTGGVLVATGLFQDSDPAASQSDELPERDENGPEIVLHFAGIGINEWQRLGGDPTTFVVESAFGSNQFSIIYSVDRSPDLVALGDIAPPSLECDARITCPTGAGDVLADRDDTAVDSIVERARLIERATRTDSGVQTTAVFLWDEDDVVRVVGDCDTTCMRLALQSLRVGDRSDVISEFDDVASRTSGRVFLGVSMVLIGFYFVVTMRAGFGRGGQRSARTGWMTVALTENEWEKLQAGKSPLNLSRKQLGDNDD